MAFDLSSLFSFIGGIGLFLLGMRVMTDGLKIAAGDTLRSILASATRSVGRGLASGILITAMVQSSSAVIFATIGFVNAGLITLYQAISMIYGANLGTTLTSWLVAVIGFNFNIRDFALPGIGIGMAFWIIMGSRPQGAIGQALAGLGLFFLGIDVLKETFASAGNAFGLGEWNDDGVWGLLVFVLAGVVLTIFTQSSSAALTVTLTAAAGGLIPLTSAAAMVIGANIGTTSTAAFAVIGATSAAKRAATAHVIFNLITGAVAFALLPALLWAIGQILVFFGAAGQIAIALALFHSLTNFIGLAIMLPQTPRLARFLEKRFVSSLEDQSKPRFLDHNVQSMPSLAISAIHMELKRMGELTYQLCAAAINAEQRTDSKAAEEEAVIESLNLKIADFATAIARSENTPDLSVQITSGIRISQHLANMAETARDIMHLHPRLPDLPQDLMDELNRLRAHSIELVSLVREESPARDALDTSATLAGFQQQYQSAKSGLLRASTQGRIPARQLVIALEQLSALDRTVTQALKAAELLKALTEFLKTDRSLATPSADPMANPPAT